MHRLCHLIHLCNVYMEHRALVLLHSSDMLTCIGAGISDTDTRPIRVVSANTNTGYWYRYQHRQNGTIGIVEGIKGLPE